MVGAVYYVVVEILVGAPLEWRADAAGAVDAV